MSQTRVSLHHDEPRLDNQDGRAASGRDHLRRIDLRRGPPQEDRSQEGGRALAARTSIEGVPFRKGMPGEDGIGSVWRTSGPCGTEPPCLLEEGDIIQ